MEYMTLTEGIPMLSSSHHSNTIRLPVNRNMVFLKRCVSFFTHIMNRLLSRKPAEMPLLFGIEVECFCAVQPGKCDSDVQSYMQARLAERGLHSKVEDLLEMSQVGNYQYVTWILTTDNSLDTDQAREVFDQTILPHLDDSDEWKEPNVCGLELVSPPLPVPDNNDSTPADAQPQMDSIRQYLDVLEGTDNEYNEHPGFVTAICGSHVHIGRPNNEAFPLPVLQHLAVSTVKYEPVINLLHPHSRTPYADTQAGHYADSNRKGLLPSRHTCPHKSYFNLADAKTKIFATETVDHLCSLMGATYPVDSQCVTETQYPSDLTDREADTSWSVPTASNTWGHSAAPGQADAPRGSKYKTVRWQLLSRADGEGPRTLEFRQAAGTLNLEEIAHNVQFNTALLRAAERQTQSNTEEPEEDIPTLRGLLVDHLRLPGHAVEYWLARAARLAELRKLARREPEDLTRWQICQECADLREERQLQRKDRAAQEIGWTSFLPTGMTEASSSRKGRRQAKRAARDAALRAERKQAGEEAQAWALAMEQEQKLDRLFAAGAEVWSQRVQRVMGLDAPLAPPVGW